MKLKIPSVDKDVEQRELIQSWWENSGIIYYGKSEDVHMLWPRNPRFITYRNWCLHKIEYMFKNVHRRTVYNFPDLKIIQMFISNRSYNCGLFWQWNTSHTQRERDRDRKREEGRKGERLREIQNTLNPKTYYWTKENRYKITYTYHMILFT